MGMADAFRYGLTVAVLVASPVLLAQDSDSDPDAEYDRSCFVVPDDLSLLALQLGGATDGLIHERIKAGDAGLTIYLLTRQILLLERIQRRMLARGFECTVALDGMRRDAGILVRSYAAFARGDAELKIEALPDADARKQAEQLDGMAQSVRSLIDGLVVPAD